VNADRKPKSRSVGSSLLGLKVILHPVSSLPTLLHADAVNLQEPIAVL